jgi:hypothetical protein
MVMKRRGLKTANREFKLITTGNKQEAADGSVFSCLIFHFFGFRVCPD